jgi:hypothetical protein
MGMPANEVIRAIVKEYPEAKASLTYGDSGKPGRGSDSIDAISALRRGGTEPDLANARRLPRLSDDHAERRNSLFGSDSDEQVAETAARDRDQFEGERLTAQLNAPLTREEQLKKLKRSKDKPQASFFGDDDEPPAQGSFVLGSGLGAMRPTSSLPARPAASWATASFTTDSSDRPEYSRFSS